MTTSTTAPIVDAAALVEPAVDRLRAAWCRVRDETSPGPWRDARQRAIKRRALLIRYAAHQLAELITNQAPEDADELTRDIVWDAAVARLVVAMGPDGEFVIGAQMDPTEREVAECWSDRLARDPKLADVVRDRLGSLPPLVAGVRAMALSDLIALVGIRLHGAEAVAS